MMSGDDGSVRGGGGGLVDLPEGCLSEILWLTTPGDLCRIEAVSKNLRGAAESDLVWERFLPVNYRDIAARSDEGLPSLFLDYPSKKKLYFRLADSPPLLIDAATKSFGINKSSGKVCCMLSATSLFIKWICNPTYWGWISDPDSRFSKVAELRDVSWLEIRGRIKMSLLTPRTRYAAYLVFKFNQRAYGFNDLAIEALVSASSSGAAIRGGGGERIRRRRSSSSNSPSEEATENAITLEKRTVYFEQKKQIRQLEIYHNQCLHFLPRTREDGWMEMEIGFFLVDDNDNDDDDDDDEVELSIREVTRLYWKGGLIVEGIELRPASDYPNIQH